MNVVEDMARLSTRFRNVFDNTDGKEVMKYLREEFYDRSLVGSDSSITHQRVGQHSVVLHILEMIDLAKQADDDGNS